MSREDTLAALEAAVSEPRPPEAAALILLAGRAWRIGQGEDAALASRANELLLRAKALPSTLTDEAILSLSTSLDPSAHSSPPVLFQALGELSTLLAGLVALDLGPTPRAYLEAALEAAVAPTRGLPELHPDRVALALLATAFIAEGGVAVGPDDTLISLADGLDPALRAVFRGERIAALVSSPPSPRDRALAPGERARLEALLARALAGSGPWALAPDLLELTPFFLASSAPELVLHEAREEAVLERQPWPGVSLRVHADVLEVELAEAGGPAPMLLPVIGDAVLAPCRCRAGATARHYVFEPSDHPAVERYVLLWGNRVIVLRS